MVSILCIHALFQNESLSVCDRNFRNSSQYVICQFSRDCVVVLSLRFAAEQPFFQELLAQSTGKWLDKGVFQILATKRLNFSTPVFTIKWQEVAACCYLFPTLIGSFSDQSASNISPDKNSLRRRGWLSWIHCLFVFRRFRHRCEESNWYVICKLIL